MATKERPVLVAIITAMGVVIAALITSGQLTRKSAARREDELERRIQYLEAELKKADRADANGGGQITATAPTVESGVSISTADPSPDERADALAREKRTDKISLTKGVRGTIADGATKEYVFVAYGNDPLLFSLNQPTSHFWAGVEILNSQGAVVHRADFIRANDQFAFTPPKDDVYVLKLTGDRNYGNFIIEMARLADGKQ